ncbi:MAG: endo-1,4-beta-xylanase [candidate division KSB1 bacterium]|nr:endo-1,4-beta-xylanase [candidate division KSB1 bacterium]
MKKCILFVAALAVLGCADSDKPTLKQVYQDYFKIGAAVNYSVASGKDPDAHLIAIREMNSITPENCMKWEHVQPNPGEFTFERADRFVKFGEEHNMFIVGHTLIWHSQTPEWVFQDDNEGAATRDLLLKRMQEHINAVTGRYAERIQAWDVLNEAIEEDGSLRQTPWLRIIGEDYIQKAFEFAKQAAPYAELYYNDYNLWKPEKRRGAIREIKKLMDAGVRIDAVGLQGHWRLGDPTLEQIQAMIEDFAKLDLKVMITELDISVLPNVWAMSADVRNSIEKRDDLNPFPGGIPDSVQTQLTERYQALFRLFLDHHQSIDRVTFWGIYDGTSWLNHYPVRGRTDYPLLFNRELQKKPAYDAVIQVAQQH